jgi:hypothetical protein
VVVEDAADVSMLPELNAAFIFKPTHLDPKDEGSI